MKNFVQKIGKTLSAMIMPIIGAFIAWGLMTAMFLSPGGWFPNEDLYAIMPIILTYLLPILITMQGGYITGGFRGSLVGSIAIIGVICGKPDTTMLMAAMIVGPLAGWLISKFDYLMENHMPAGFEMLINNFSAGILGIILCIIGYYGIAPVMDAILNVLAAGVDFLINVKLLPCVAVFLEPAKVLFLNNAINHGIFTPLGASDVAETGRSIMFMLEANPGPGLGVLLAFCFFSKDPYARRSAPGAVIIHFFGGIHEIYFPYVLSKPSVIIAPIAGNLCAIIWFMFMNAGLMGPASPGSIVSFIMMSPRDLIWVSAVGVLIATVVSFLIASPIVRFKNGKSIEEATDQMKELKGEAKEVKKIVFSCDAGMGSSAMGATKFKKRIKDVCPDIEVTYSSVDSVPEDADVVVCQNQLKERARKSAPKARLVIINSFLGDPALDELYDSLAKEEKSELILKPENVLLGCVANSKIEAIELSGAKLIFMGCCDIDYAMSMQEREKIATTYLGQGIAIPHGTNEMKSHVIKSGIAFAQYPKGVSFGDEKAYIVIGIAGKGDEHIDLLAKISEKLDNPEIIEKLKTTEDPQEVCDIINS